MDTGKEIKKIAGYKLNMQRLEGYKVAHHLDGFTRQEHKLRTVAQFHYNFQIGRFKQRLDVQFSDAPKKLYFLTTEGKSGYKKSMALENMFNEIAVVDKPLAVPSERIKIFEKRAGTFGEQFYQESGVKLDINETMALYDYISGGIRQIEGVANASPNDILWRCENALGESVIKQYKDIEDYDLIFGGWHASVIDDAETTIFHEANPSIAEAFLEDCNNEIKEALEAANKEAVLLQAQLDQAQANDDRANQELLDYIRSGVDDWKNEYPERSAEKNRELLEQKESTAKAVNLALIQSNANADKLIHLNNLCIARLKFQIALSKQEQQPIVSTIQ